MKRRASGLRRQLMHSRRQARTPLVEALEARRLLATLTVNSSLDIDQRDDVLTLREAILIANGTLDPETLTALEQAQFDPTTSTDRDTIAFNIPEGGIQTIDVAVGGLPAITAPVLIDGTTQPDFDDSPIIVLDGSLTESVSGLVINASAAGSSIRGLVIHSFSSSGILLLGGSNLIAGNYIGTDVTGTVALGNENVGVFVFSDSSDNTIGGTVLSERNVISGNQGAGIAVFTATASGNLILGNFIGTNAQGTGALPNLNTGIFLDNAPNNTVGGDVSGAGNLISGNQGAGIAVFGATASGNLIQGNLIGTDINGTATLANSNTGVFLDNAPNNTIGGVTEETRNLISGNQGAGVAVFGASASGNLILGNFIGTDLNGELALPNTNSGVLLDNASNNTVGGTMPGGRNVLSGNQGAGVYIFGSAALGNLVAGNFIGIDVDGIQGLGNTFEGVLIQDSADNTVGGTTDTARNVISNNGTTGVRLLGSGATRNLIAGNFIGTDITGNSALGNGGDGLLIENAPENVIGLPGAGNVISGNGNLFDTPTRLTLLQTMSEVVTGDFNNDGLDDIAATTSDIYSSIFVYLNQGDGTFSSTPINIDLGINPVSLTTVRTGFFGNLGLAALDRDSGQLFVLSGNGDGTFNLSQTFSVGPDPVLVRANDINGDFIDDLVVANALNPGLSSDGDVRAYLGTISGTYDPAAPIFATDQLDPTGLFAGYFGFDIDTFESIYGVVVSDAATDTLQIIRFENGAFGAPTIRAAGGQGPAGVTLEDVTNDGLLDLIVALSGSDQVAVHFASGVGVFGLSRNFEVGSNPQDVVVSDFDGDGLMDIATANAGSNDISVLLRRPNLSVRSAISIPVGSGPVSLAVGGFRPSPGSPFTSGFEAGLVVLNQSSADLSVFLRNLDALHGVRIVGSAASGNIIQGNLIGTNADGTAELGNLGSGVMVVDAPGTLIGLPGAGNLISGNSRSGVSISGAEASGTVIQGNRIGTNVSGTTAINNLQAGIQLDAAPDTTIGGTTSGAGNLISGNLEDGIRADGEVLYAPDTFEFLGVRAVTGTLIQGNIIGLAADGTTLLGNGRHGVRLEFSSFTTIGGTTESARNIISGNGDHGIDLEGASPFFYDPPPFPYSTGGSNNLILGNFIGTDITGTLGRGNVNEGIYLFDAPNNTIGGPTPEARNIISANGDDGIAIRSSPLNNPDYPPLFVSSNNLVQGNFIGTNVNGTQALGNGTDSTLLAAGIFIADSPDNVILGNLISGNIGRGMLVSRAGTQRTLIAGNFIGTDVSGTLPLGNTLTGVLFHNNTSNNRLGALDALPGNIIAFNGGDGVRVSVGDLPRKGFPPPFGIVITQNSIFSNGLLGIDLGGDGPTSNDSLDSDIGPNNFQNFPVLTSATIDPNQGLIQISGTLHSTPGTEFVMEFFADEGDPSGFGEGRTFLGSTLVTTSLNPGNASFDVFFSADSLLPGQVITATATGPSGTSEFSMFITPLTLEADLSITASSAPPTAQINEFFTYHFQVLNNGPSSAEFAYLSASIPLGLEVLSITTSQGSVFESDEFFSVDFGNLEWNASVNVIVTARSATPGSYPITASVSSETFDPNPMNNEATATVEVAGTPAERIAVIESIGPITEITIGGDGTFQVIRDPFNSGQVFPSAQAPGDAGIFIRQQDGTVVGLDPALHPITFARATRAQPFNTVSLTKSNDGLSVTSVMNNLGDGNTLGNFFQVTQVSSYVPGNPFFTVVNTIQNQGNAPLVIDFFAAADLFLADSDEGIGFFDPVTGAVGGIDATGTFRIFIQPIIVNGSLSPDHYQEGFFDAIWQVIGTPGANFNNTIDPNFIDNGAGLQWQNLSIPVGASVSIAYIWEFEFFEPIEDFTVRNTNDSGPNSLRQAILNANSVPGVQTINFEIPDSFANPDGTFTINVLTPLPWITEGVVIDATTQPGHQGFSPIVELVGANLSSGDGFVITADAAGTTIQGFTINQFMGSGIVILGGGNNQVFGNFIGTDRLGTSSQGNGSHGIAVLDSAGNTIGGAGPLGNIISGNGADGVHLTGSNSFGNILQGNHIGTGFAIRPIALGNAGSGISIVNGAGGNLIGGLGELEGNTITNNGAFGILIVGASHSAENSTMSTSGNLIQANRIGIPEGPSPLFNEIAGILILESSNNVIDAGNWIAGGNRPGVRIVGDRSQGNRISNNRISNSATLPGFLDGQGIGVLIEHSASNNTIGGADSGLGNIISGNGLAGVALANNARENLVQFNTIGGIEASDGNGHGVLLQIGASANLIHQNSVFGNNYGVTLAYGASGNRVEGNRIGGGGPASQPFPGNLMAGVTILDAFNNTIGGTESGNRNIISGNGVGVYIVGSSSGNRISGNFIGTDPTGFVSFGNRSDGIFLENASNNQIDGNLISGNDFVGIQILGETARFNTVFGNLIGVNVDGTAPLPNLLVGVYLNNSGGNVIGSNDLDRRNIISGNGQVGVQFLGPGASGNIVLNNFIGTDISGTRRVANGDTGLFLENSPGNSIIGNVISGHIAAGVNLFGPGSSSNVLQGNHIGTGVEGRAAIPNRFGVIVDNAPENLIGGMEPGQGNLISGNLTVGVGLFETSARGNIIANNRIGTDVNGLSALGNRLGGIFVNAAPENVIAGNIISGNGGTGIQIFRPGASGNSVLGNVIGTDLTGLIPIGNQEGGVFINAAPFNMIRGNLISANESFGVQIFSNASTGTILTDNFIGALVPDRPVLGNPYGLFVNAASGAAIIGGDPALTNSIVNNRLRNILVLGQGVGPTVSAIELIGPPGQISAVVLSFSEALNPSRAEILRLYRVLLTSGSTRIARLTSARYNNLDFSVTLTLATPIPRNASFRLTIDGTQPNGLTDQQGDPLDGNADGVSGDNFSAVFDQGILVRPGYLVAGRAETPVIAPEALDSLLVTDELQELSGFRARRFRN